MAIQNRRGAYTDFDPTKMVAGEFAVVQSGDENTEDGKALYVAPTTGSVKRIPFADELGDLVEIDDTLTEAGAAADAKKTGDEIADLKSDLITIQRLNNNEDLNDILNPGTYALHGTQTYSNLPGNQPTNAILEVWEEILNDEPVRIFQRLTSYAAGKLMSTLWIRTYSTPNQSWSIWVNTSDLKMGDKKFLFVGDSYAQGYSHDGSNSGWCNYLAGYLGLVSGQYSITAQGGAGFGNGGFTTLVQNATGSDYTDIIVCGGYNDNNQAAATIRQGIEGFVSAVQDRWPAAKIHVGFIAAIKQGTGEGAVSDWITVKRNLEQTVLFVYQRCTMYGCQYINNIEYWLNSNGQRGISKSDGYHPNANGNQYIAWGIANALKTGSASMPGYDYDKTVIMSADQFPEMRESLMIRKNIGLDDSSNALIFEKMIEPVEINQYKLCVYANNTLSIMDASYACYKKYSVTPGKTYYLSGRHFYTDRPFYLLLNSLGNVIGYYNGGTVGHNIDNYELIIPDNAVTLIVQGSRVLDGARITVTQVPEIQRNSFYEEAIMSLKSGDFTKCEFLSVSYGACVKYAVTPNIGYCLVGGRHYYTDYPLYIIVDANNTVLKYHDGGTTGYDNKSCYFSVPENGAYIYVNVSVGFVNTVKLYENGTYYTLKSYVGEKVDNIVKQFMTTTVTPQMFGAKANGVADDTLAITNAIDAAQGGTVRFPKGTYAISSPIKTFRGNSKCTELVFDEGAVVVAISQVPYILELGVLGSDEVVDHVRKTLRGGLFDGSNGNVTTAVVHIGRRCMTLDMSDFQIYSNGCDGLHVGDSDTVTPIDANIHNGFIKNTGSNNSNSGIKIFGTDNNLSDLRIYYYQKAIEALASAQFLNDIHTMPKNVATPATTSLYIGDNVHVQCSNFYGDSEDTFVYIGNNSILIGNNLYYYSYRSNSVTFFDVHSNPKIMVSGFHLYGKDSDYIGVKLNSGNLKDVLSKGNFLITGMDMDNAQYIRNGDPLKCAIASNGQPLFNTTSISANTWYYVCSYPADANTEHWFKLFNGFKHTVIPVNVKYSSGLVDELLSNVVDSDDTNVFDIGFSLLNTTSGYALINVYVKASTATKISDFWVESKLAVGGSSAYQKSDTALSSVSVTPTIAYRVDCANKTVTKLT